ncbi:hypothetical protein C1T17_17430 [Sphingobium sp. SCG-1]|uniref:hypothetical protein n=1 Tax=Sphingobium sp. SCG-1 TaxID=2072936 RepID=UPI000CD68180|nr:hypothetical protein [Sphingobium sp. SCG-1]AUW59596.1 hypothetical protein C1T17_17430 [Sphingobium sp. SCG-1]
MAAMSGKWIRMLFAGPGAIILALVMMAGMTQWLPKGAAGIDNLVLPLVLAPLLWAALFFHACMDRKLSRVAIVALGLLVIHGGLVAHSFLSHAPVAKGASK